MKLILDESGILKLSENIADNIYHWEEVGDFRLEYLNEDIIGNKGGNSFVFKLINTEDESEVFVIKFLRHPLKAQNRWINERFEREIEALKKAREMDFNHVVQILYEGRYTHIQSKKKFRYYIMEKADGDLRDFILNNENQMKLSQKIALCYDIIKGINELHCIDIYHRDIKPDNIFLFNEDGKSIWKIGDLGLISKRGEDLFYEKGKKIGPANWMSPEAMNNALCGNTVWASQFDTSIDEKSDVFQLGNVIWFVFNHNAPVGQVTIDDFHIREYVIFSLIFTMLRHKKHNRKDLFYYEKYFLKLDEFYLSKRKKTSKWFTTRCKKILKIR